MARDFQCNCRRGNEGNTSNNLCYLTKLGDVPKQIIIGDYIYAFVEDEGLALWIFNVDSWVEVSDLTDVPVWVYQEIKSYAVAIGWIKENQDLFSVRDMLLRDQELVCKENERLLKKLEEVNT